jgi:hypothetical protein
MAAAAGAGKREPAVFWCDERAGAHTLCWAPILPASRTTVNTASSCDTRVRIVSILSFFPVLTKPLTAVSSWSFNQP